MPVGPAYALIPVSGYGIAVMTAARMLDPDGVGAARILRPGEPVPVGAQPVVLAMTTVYDAVCVEHLLREWHPQVPSPWLVLLADAPTPSAPAGRYRLRALKGRLAGVARVPYLPVLRAVDGAQAALQYTDVQSAAAKLRRDLEGK